MIRIAGCDLEYEWHGCAGGSPLLFLHEGLGCITMWRRFPADVAMATRHRALVYSRRGYGRSSPVGRARSPLYMHEEALDVLPELRMQLGLDTPGDGPPVLVGHSDGASIALIHAGDGRWPVAGLVLIAPHVFVEPETITGIEAARRTYLSTDLRERLARFHADPDATFWGWNDVWLSPEFRSWSIEEYLPRITCPVLILQGEDDEYGTVAQADAISRAARGPVATVMFPGCRHSPHLDEPVLSTEAVTSFLRDIDTRAGDH
ncbi:MAG: alpha/beta fold hydrolase [Acidimicrobiales bacterium]